MGVGGQCGALAALPPGNIPVQMYRRLGGPQGHSGWVKSQHRANKTVRQNILCGVTHKKSVKSENVLIIHFSIYECDSPLSYVPQMTW
jgi:hypothetical protein